MKRNFKMFPYDGKIIKNKQNVRQENIVNLFFYEKKSRPQERERVRA